MIANNNKTTKAYLREYDILTTESTNIDCKNKFITLEIKNNNEIYLINNTSIEKHFLQPKIKISKQLNDEVSQMNYIDIYRQSHNDIMMDLYNQIENKLTAINFDSVQLSTTKVSDGLMDTYKNISTKISNLFLTKFLTK